MREKEKREKKKIEDIDVMDLGDEEYDGQTDHDVTKHGDIFSEGWEK